MMNFLHKMYNRIKELKKYHAMHAFTAIPGSLVILAYTVTFIINIIDGYEPLGSQLILAFFLIVYFFILCISSIIAICIFIFLLLLSIFKKKKFFVNSLFLLNNKYYNFFYLFSPKFIFWLRRIYKLSACRNIWSLQYNINTISALDWYTKKHIIGFLYDEFLAQNVQTD